MARNSEAPVDHMTAFAGVSAFIDLETSLSFGNKANPVCRTRRLHSVRHQIDFDFCGRRAIGGFSEVIVRLSCENVASKSRPVWKERTSAADTTRHDLPVFDRKSGYHRTKDEWRLLRKLPGNGLKKGSLGRLAAFINRCGEPHLESKRARSVIKLGLAR